MAMETGADGLLSVVIPAYNEQDGIAALLGEVKAALGGLSCASEIVVVDDASRDETAGVVSAIEGIRLVRNPVNLGYGHSIMRGIQAARGDVIAICDADGSYDPSSIPALYARTQQGVDHSIGRRTGSNLKRRWMGRDIYRALCGYVVGTNVPDANSGLRIFRRRVAESLGGELCRGFSFTTSLTLASYMCGYVVSFTDVPYRPRVGKSHVTFRDVLRTAQYLFQLTATYNPLKLFLPLVVLSGALAVAGLVGAGLGLGSSWALLGAMMGAATLLLAGLAVHAYVISGAPARASQWGGDARTRR
jgi:glycosyltransferase involved in cell wall biosynthesis